jgi:uncharacterized protein YjbJ (UPF0337 family)
MSKTEVKESWTEQKEKLKQQFSTLINKDSLFEDGKKEEILEKLQIKLGKTKEELNNIIAAL